MSKIILITGASTGFGHDTALSLIGEGYKVFASMRDPLGKNSVHAQKLTAAGAYVVELDVINEQSIEQAIQIVKDQAGHIDVLINNAGIASAGVTEAFSTEQMVALFDVNVFGVHRVIRSVLPMMRENKKGLIINVGSILGRVTFPFFGIYGASKYAVEALTDSLRYEVSQFGVDVALIQPSAYPTDMYGSAQQPLNSDCVKNYGDVGEIPGAMFSSFMSMFEAADAPKPHDIAEAIVELIKTPDGQRPARTVVGNSFGSEAINAAVAPIQNAVMQTLGLGHLEALKKS
ncbi:SDR family oxidoreductase [Psychromonas sp. L1A2]|uniref:SDR family oxidoreductase n=1 Tax=Psychromonas sp. L1A2 TaxID=2686356 RepID=UPI001356B687|nr:SDR family oxidoreductase [Psychromonas sp. L1A2]